MRKFSTSSGQFRHKKMKIIERIQILQWIPKYTKLDFVSDIIGGLTVGMMMIPQSIAYAGLAGLPAQYGLYTAFIGSFTYVIFGSIKQVSIGPTSLMSMLSFTYLHGYPVDYIIFLTFIAGCVEFTMGVLHLGFLVDFISPSVSAGFTAAISLIIMASQLKSFFGLRFEAHSFTEVIVALVKNLSKISINDTILGISCLAFLLILKKLATIRFKNKTAKKSMWFISISRNALIVIISSSIAFYYHKVDGAAPFSLSSKVPSGLPTFSPPKFWSSYNNETTTFLDMLHTIGSGVFVIPVCAILSNVAIAKSFAAGVIVDSSQEMITLGLCNIFGSFVQAMPSSGAFSRSAVANSSGVSTPLQGLYSGTVIILALSFLTPYFGFIPKATLAAVLIAAVGTLIDYSILPVLWRTNKFDFCLCVLTCCVGVIYGADIGIITGASLNLLVLIKVWSRPNILIKVKSFDGCSKSYLFIKPEFGLYYPAKDFLIEKVIEANNQFPSLAMILDCSDILRVDYAAAEALNYLLEFYNKDQDKLVLINLNSHVLNTMKALMNTQTIKYCRSCSVLSEDIFEFENLPETKIPLLGA